MLLSKTTKGIGPLSWFIVPKERGKSESKFVRYTFFSHIWVLFVWAFNLFFLFPCAFVFTTGPEEDVPRKMEYFEFVCHAPSDYFHSRNAPYSIRSMTIEPGSVWTSLKAGIQPSFGSIASQDDFDHDSKLGDLKALSKTETGRRVRDLNRKQLVSRDRKLSKRELQHFWSVCHQAIRKYICEMMFDKTVCFFEQIWIFNLTVHLNC